MCVFLLFNHSEIATTWGGHAATCGHRTATLGGAVPSWSRAFQKDEILFLMSITIIIIIEKNTP